MNNLPVEILHLIFSLLIQRDKLECMTVCRQWKQVIHDGSLFQIIYVNRQQQLDQLIKRVKQDSILGTRLDRLTLELKLDPNYNANDLVDLFPNLRRFTIFNLNYDFDDPQPLKLRRHHPWCETIRQIEELFSDLNAIILLRSGLCKNLTLIITSGYTHERACDLIELLSNAPALNTLHLDCYMMTYQEFELLHEKVPCLRSLWLIDIDSDKCSFPLTIKTATLMKELRCISSFKESHENEAVRYFSRKYTQLEELTLDLLADYPDEEFNMESFGRVADQREMVTAFIKILAPQLRTLRIITTPLNDNYLYRAINISMMNECNCRIKTLELDYAMDAYVFETLSETTQAQYIESLTIHAILPSSDFGLISDKWISSFKVLKELSLKFTHEKQYTSMRAMNLTDFLEILGDIQLETLSLHSLRLNFSSARHISEYPSLKNLTLSNTVLEKRTDWFISKVFPNLKHLTLDRCPCDRDVYMFTYTSLSNLEITDNFTAMVLVVCLGNNQQRLYTKSTGDTNRQASKYGVKRDIFSLPSIHSQPFDKSESFRTLTIVCNSVRDCFIHNMEN